MNGTYKCVHKMRGPYTLEKIIKHSKRFRMDNLSFFFFFFFKEWYGLWNEKNKEKQSYTNFD